MTSLLSSLPSLPVLPSLPLPPELINEIVKYLPINDLCNLRLTCKQMKEIVNYEFYKRAEFDIEKVDDDYLDKIMNIKNCKEIDDLPKNIVSIKFNDKFNEDISALTKLQNLQTLTLGSSFDQEIKMFCLKLLHIYICIMINIIF